MVHGHGYRYDAQGYGRKVRRYAIVAEFEGLYGEVEGSLLRYQKFYLIGEFPIELRDRGIC
jgi:hypothetical protein